MSNKRKSTASIFASRLTEENLALKEQLRKARRLIHQISNDIEEHAQAVVDARDNKTPKEFYDELWNFYADIAMDLQSIEKFFEEHP